MAARGRKRSWLVDEATAMWPSLPFLAFGVWNAWAALTYSGSLWLSDNEVDGTYLSQLYIFSAFAFSAVALCAALLARKGAARAMADNRLVVGGGVLASAGCLLIIAVGPYYLGDWLYATFGKSYRVAFWLGALASGAGTALIGLRCGCLFGTLTPRRTLIYVSLSQLVAAFIYLLAFACPTWAPVEHGPSLVGILFFCGLPLLAAALACVEPSKSTGIDECLPEAYVGGKGDPHASRLPPVFWRFVAFTFFMSLFTSIPRSAVVTTHALASTVEGSNLLTVLRVITALVFVAYALGGGVRGFGFGKVCSMLAVFSAVVTACAAAFGGLTNGWSLVVYFAANIFEFVMWCLLAFIVVQKRVSAVVVFGLGRGFAMLGCGVGWLVGYVVIPLVPEGATTTALFLAMAGAMVLLALGLFSERDYERLFSPVSEEELSLEDLFDIERREQEYAAERKSEKRGRFSRAVEEVVQEYGLSIREGDVLRCLAMGYGSDRIAEHLQVKVNTVRAHTHNVYVKLDVHSREELMKLVDDAVAKQ